MEEFFTFLGFVALFAIPILWSRHSRLRKEFREAEEHQRKLLDRVNQLDAQFLEVSKLTGRIRTLEHELHARPAVAAPEPHERAATPPPVTPHVPASVAAPPLAAAPPPAPTEPAAPRYSVLPPATVIPPPPVLPPPPAIPDAAKTTPAAPATTPLSTAPTPAPPPSPPRPAPLAGAPAAAPHPPAAKAPATAAESKASRRARAFDIEQALGTNWLSKLGIVILVFGVVFWLGTQWQNLTPLLKVAVGYAVGGGLLATGILLEKRWNYALLGRTTAGGGWALLYFTTYAMHHLAATRVIESQSVDL